MSRIIITRAIFSLESQEITILLKFQRLKSFSNYQVSIRFEKNDARTVQSVI